MCERFSSEGISARTARARTEDILLATGKNVTHSHNVLSRSATNTRPDPFIPNDSVGSKRRRHCPVSLLTENDPKKLKSAWTWSWYSIS
jgi:hypothetical protein